MPTHSIELHPSAKYNSNPNSNPFFNSNPVFNSNLDLKPSPNLKQKFKFIEGLVDISPNGLYGNRW